MTGSRYFGASTCQHLSADVIADRGNVTALKEEEEWHEHTMMLTGRQRKRRLLERPRRDWTNQISPNASWMKMQDRKRHSLDPDSSERLC